MDYKEAVDMLGWMARHAKLSGTDARVLTVMVSEANYRTSELSVSYDDIAQALRVSKQSAMLAVKRLERAGAIKRLADSIGRTSASYKVRSVQDLKLLHESDEFNAEWRAWSEARDALFFDFETELQAVGDGCEDCTDEAMCGTHERQKAALMDSAKGREMRLWDSDHKKPPSSIKRVKFIQMEKI